MSGLWNGACGWLGGSDRLRTWIGNSPPIIQSFEPVTYRSKASPKISAMASLSVPASPLPPSETEELGCRMLNARICVISWPKMSVLTSPVQNTQVVDVVRAAGSPSGPLQSCDPTEEPSPLANTRVTVSGTLL